MEFQHTSVLLKETIDALVTRPDGIYVDCTLGGAGHSSAVAERLKAEGRLVGIDQDPAAILAAKKILKNYPCYVDILFGNFRNLKNLLAEIEVTKVSGFLFDLGVSSHQLDVAERGFSYMQDGPLDMRMGPENPRSAYDVVNGYPEEKLASIIAGYGEERWAKRIAKMIVQARKAAPISTTSRLVEIIKQAIPAAARREGPHPAKRTFQAIRIEVNDELGILRSAMEDAVELLEPGGRLCVITFHSLEDRIIKQTMQDLAKTCTCPKDYPICICETKPKVRVVTKPVAPSPEELETNPRARSAKLRVAERL